MIGSVDRVYVWTGIDDREHVLLNLVIDSFSTHVSGALHLVLLLHLLEHLTETAQATKHNTT